MDAKEAIGEWVLPHDRQGISQRYEGTRQRSIFSRSKNRYKLLNAKALNSQGGLQDDDSSSSALTAYILISLLESGVPLTATLINNALHCLEKGMENGGGTTYTAAISTYALSLLEHPKANNSMKLLMERATRNNV